jgi:hypothetical protein
VLIRFADVCEASWRTVDGKQSRGSCRGSLYASRYFNGPNLDRFTRRLLEW